MIKFNNIQIPDFVKINSISNPILPSVSQNTVKVSGRAGLIDFGNELGEREIDVAISIIADSPSNLRTKIRQLAEWLYYDEPKQLVLPDEPHVYYMAKITDDTNIDEILHVGQGVIKFVCHDPHAYSINEKINNLNFTSVETPEMVINTGGLKTYPIMEFNFNNPTTSFSVITNNEVMTFGNSDIDKTPKNINPLVWHDPMESITGWTTANRVDDGVITGSFKSNGWSISANDYGTGTTWHGPSGVKALPNPLQDFTLKSLVGLVPNKIGEMGRVQIYGLDINGNQVFLVSIRNGNPHGITPYAQVKIGNKYVLETYGDYKGVWKNFYDGKMEITRKGNVWAVYYAIRGSDGKDHTRMYKTFNDTNVMNKVAQIQIHIGAYGEAPPVPTMYIADLKVYDESPILENNEIPYVFQAGDNLIIDSKTGGVYLNGEPYFEYLDPSSQFPILEKGANGITVSPLVVSNGVIKFRERWL